MIKNLSLIGLLITACIEWFLQSHQYVNFDVKLILCIIIILFIVGLISCSIHDLKFKKEKEEQFKKKEIFFISLLSIYQPLYFYTHNIVELNFSIGLFLCSFVYLQFILLFCLTNIFFKDRNKSLFIALIFSFTLLNFYKSPLIFYIILAVYLWFISKVSLIKIKKPAIVFAAVLVSLAIFEFESNYFKILTKSKVNDSNHYESVLPYIKQGTRNRDVYIILLDEYGGTNTLKQKFGFDNSDFINELKKEGFFVFDKMYSNYDLTYTSIPSILNLEYYENLDFNISSAAIANSTLYKVAKIKGYKTVFMKNQYFSELKSSEYLDYIFETQNKNLYYSLYTFFFNGIYRDIINSMDIKYFLNNKKNNAFKINGKKFVFMHMLMPHGPYLYDENHHKSKYMSDFENGYLPYLKYANKWTLDEIKQLKEENKDNPPVIIITGDHGIRYKPILESNFSTFTAIYNPEEEYSRVKNSKTLINFFINFANYEFNTTFPNKKDTVTCARDICGAKIPGEKVTEITIKDVLKDTIDLTDKFIK